MSNLPKNQQMCSVCESEPQDMLILSCRHNLCLDCATEVYNLNTKQDKIVCEICLSETGLDEETIICLRSLSAKTANTNHIANGNYFYEQSQTRHNYPPNPKSHTLNLSRQNNLPIIQQQQALMLKCQKHNEPLTYFCLDCNIFKICSQCMLLQNHRYHKVITIKKATFQIKETIQKVGRQKEKLKNLLERDRSNLITRKEDSEKQLEVNLNGLKIDFDELNAILWEKFQQIKIKMEDDARRKLQIMDGAVNQIEEKIKLIEETVQFEGQLVESAVNGNDPKSIFQMFEYYQSQMNQHRLNFQPSLPNFIAQIADQSLENKPKFFEQFQQLIDNLLVSSSLSQGDRSYDQNINYISQIENQNLLVDLNQNQKQDRKDFSLKKKYPNGKHEAVVDKAMNKRPVSQNINIIQLQNRGKEATQQNINNYKQQPKRPKQGIQSIKRKARQNFKERDLSSSRKMQLSRSIVNATEILNKIQERSSRI